MAVELAPTNVSVEQIDINLLQPHPRNVEIYGINEDVSELAKKIQEKGKLDYNIVVNQHNRIISGHRRWQATKLLKWTTVPVERRVYTSELEELEALLIANVYRDKTHLQRASEFEMWLEVYKGKAKQSQGNRPSKLDEIQTNNAHFVSNLTQSSPQEPTKPKSAPKSRDQAAKDVGLGAISATKSVNALHAVKQLKDDGKIEEARVLEEVTNKSIDAGSKLANLEKPDNLAILTKIATKEAKDVKEAKKLVKKEKIEQLHRKVEEASDTSEVKEREIETGQIWKLGKHLLYCGDSSSEDFQELAKKADLSLAFADPPYNAGVDDWDINFEWKHDYLAKIAPIVAVTPGISAIKDFMCVTEMPYKWSMAYWLDNGMARGPLGFGKWIYAALFSNGSIYRNKPDFDRVSVSTNEWDGDGEFDHKGRKPLSMMLHLIETLTEEDDIILDPFLGTGTTLAVCEQSKRICIGAEISPEYCKGIIQRWEKLSGAQAEEVTNVMDTLFF